MEERRVKKTHVFHIWINPNSEVIIGIMQKHFFCCQFELKTDLSSAMQLMWNTIYLISHLLFQWKISATTFQINVCVYFISFVFWLPETQQKKWKIETMLVILNCFLVHNFASSLSKTPFLHNSNNVIILTKSCNNNISS